MRDRLRALLRQVVPYPLRVELARLRHAPGRLLQRPNTARSRTATQPLDFLFVDKSSPMHRDLDGNTSAYALAKERNVAVSAAHVDGLVIRPHQVFSFHSAVGRPSVWRGFRRGLELHDERPSAGVGGGACKLSNLLYLVALFGGMKIVERHRHALDLFPDKGRTVPFGCGATVSYNYADFRFENPLSQAVRIRARVQDGKLIVQLWLERDPGFVADIYEVDHRFERVGSAWFRQNKIRRKFVRHDGSLLRDEEVTRNVARVLYEPHLALPAATLLHVDDTSQAPQEAPEPRSCSAR